MWATYCIYPFPYLKVEAWACLRFQGSSKAVAVLFHEERKTHTGLQDLSDTYIQMFQKRASLITCQGLFLFQKLIQAALFNFRTPWQNDCAYVWFEQEFLLDCILWSEVSWRHVLPPTECRKSKGFFMPLELHATQKQSPCKVRHHLPSPSQSVFSGSSFLTKIYASFNCLLLL